MSDEEKKENEINENSGIPSPLSGEMEDDVVEFEYNADGEEDLKATLKKLRKSLKEEKQKSQEYLTNWQRERADFTNFKKDEMARIGRSTDSVREQFTEELLPVLDAYDIAFSNKEAWEKVEKNWRMGVEYIHQQLIKVLADNGVTEIAPKEGDPMDSTLHEPIESIETEDNEKEHTVAKLVQKGYKSSDRVIRPARIKVWAKKD